MSGGTLGFWTSVAPYPLNIYDEDCADWQGYLVCIGGNNYSFEDIQEVSSVYFYSGGQNGAWTLDSGQPYPTPAIFYPSEACVTDSTTYLTCPGVYVSSVAATTVTIPMTFTLGEAGAPSTNILLSGCQATPSSVPGDGLVHDVTALPGCTITIGLPPRRDEHEVQVLRVGCHGESYHLHDRKLRLRGSPVLLPA